MSKESKESKEACPCASGAPFAACCEPYLTGKKPVPTAEALMRSRYSAYAKGAIDYLIETHAPGPEEEHDRPGMEKWSKESTWTGLDVIATEAGKEGDEKGIVEFRARWRVGDGPEQSHHERSEFRRIEGKWRYVDGKPVKPAPVVRQGEKTGRNDPCPCGSGKKYKRCHGQA